MTPQEEGMLNDLVRKINATSLQEKDDSAERLLQNGLGRNPDALYMLAQTVLVQNIALEQAKQQMTALQQAPPQPQKATSFLGSLLGHHDPQPQPQPSQGYQTGSPAFFARRRPRRLVLPQARSRSRAWNRCSTAAWAAAVLVVDSVGEILAAGSAEVHRARK